MLFYLAKHFFSNLYINLIKELIYGRFFIKAIRQ